MGSLSSPSRPTQLYISGGSASHRTHTCEVVKGRSSSAHEALVGLLAFLRHGKDVIADREVLFDIAGWAHGALCDVRAENSKMLDDENLPTDLYRLDLSELVEAMNKLGAA